MKKISPNELSKSEEFLWLSARLLERRRFEVLFRGGLREPLLAALRGYQNVDGGFGQAIEPDFRGPISQPLGVDFALRVIEEVGPEATMLESVLAYVTSVTAADGGVPNVSPDTAKYPRAPWWEPAPGSPGCLLPTASIAGLLFKLRVEHVWLERASQFTWSAIDRLIQRAAQSGDRLARLQVAYEARATLTFLDHTPERAKAERAASELGRALEKAGLIAKEDGVAEAMAPLDYAPAPDSIARRWFDDALIERHLDALVDARAADGGWTVPWMIWTPQTQPEWRGVLTVERLKTLRSHGRL